MNLWLRRSGDADAGVGDGERASDSAAAANLVGSARVDAGLGRLGQDERQAVRPAEGESVSRGGDALFRGTPFFDIRLHGIHSEDKKDIQFTESGEILLDGQYSRGKYGDRTAGDPAR